MQIFANPVTLIGDGMEIMDKNFAGWNMNSKMLFMQLCTMECRCFAAYIKNLAMWISAPFFEYHMFWYKTFLF